MNAEIVARLAASLDDEDKMMVALAGIERVSVNLQSILREAEQQTRLLEQRLAAKERRTVRKAG